MTNHRVYEGAAGNIQRGWMRGDFTSPDGERACLVQGVLNTLKLDGTKLPSHVEAEIDAELEQYWFYRQLRLVYGNRPDFRNGWSPVQCAIMAWNDMPWRRKRSVVRTLKSLALSFALDEISMLRVQLTQLREENTQLAARIERLERENEHLWRRLRNYAKLRDTRKQQTQVSRQMDAIDRELAELTEQYAPS